MDTSTARYNLPTTILCRERRPRTSILHHRPERQIDRERKRETDLQLHHSCVSTNICYNARERGDVK